MISYNNMQFMRPRGRGPESGPQEHPDIAPFPLWLVPPVWRCARRSAILAAMAHWCEEHQAVEEKEQMTTQVLARWFERLDVAWNHAQPLEEWHVRDTDDVLIVWKTGKRASQ